MSALNDVFELSIIIQAVDKWTAPMRKMQESMKYSQQGMDAITKSMKAMGASSSEIDKVSTAMDKWARKESWNKIAQDMKNAKISQQQIDEMAKGYDKLATQQERLQKSMKTMVAGGVVTGIGFKMAEGFVHAADEAGKLLTVMTTIQDATGASDSQMNSIRHTITSTSAVTRYGIMDTAGIAQILATSGYDPSQTNSLLPVFTKFAEVQQYGKGASPDESVKQAIELAHGFQKYTPDQLDTFLNMYNKGTFLQPEDSAKFGETLKYLMTTAGSLGMSDQDTVYMAALANRMGLAGSMGGTNSADMLMRAIPGISGGLKQNKDGTYAKQLTAMMKMGLSDASGNSPFFDQNGKIINLAGFIDTLYMHSKDMTDVQRYSAFHDIFGIQGNRAADLFGSQAGMDQLKALHEGMTRMGSIDQFQGDFLNTPEGQINQFKSNLDNLKFSVFLEMAKVLNPILEKLNGVVSKIIEFTDQHPKIAQFIATFAAIGTSVALIVGPMLSLVGMIGMLSAGFEAIGGVAAGVILAIPAALAAIAAGAYLMYKNWDTIKKDVKPITDALGITSSGAVKPTRQGGAQPADDGTVSQPGMLQQMGNKIKETYGDIAQTSKTTWQEVVQDLKDAIAAMSPYFNFWGTTMWYSFKIPLDAMLYSFKFMFDQIMDLSKLLTDSLSTTFMFFSDLAHGNFTKAQQNWTNGWKKFNSDIGQMGNDMKMDFTSFANVIGQDMADAGINIAKSFVENFGQAAASGIDNFFQSHPTIMKMMSMTGWGQQILSTIQQPSSDSASANYGVASHITKHALGGIFSTPHFAQVAEDGTEAIIPLTKRARGLQLWQQAGQALGVNLAGGGGGDAPVVINIYPLPHQSPTEIAQAASRELGRVAQTKVRNSGMRVNRTIV